MKHFNEYKQLNLAEVSKTILEQWEKENLFHKSIETREGQPSFLFFEGPPSANGMPGIHHVMARTIKDTFCRFKTMQGYQVKRKAGWDTHGLPVELGVEKLLGITKEDIGKKISVDEYNAACRREVMKYTQEWTNLTKQMGYWVDLDNPYITYDNKFIETLWWLLKELYKKGYLYKGYTIQPYSPAAGTGLSSHELNQPGCYRDVKDTTCTAQFKISGIGNRVSGIGDAPLYALAWTTTPWTLPSNTALCVGPKIDYVIVKGENPYTKLEAYYLLAEARLAAYSKELGEAPEVLWKGKGADLVGIEYEQLIPWANPGEGAFKIIPGDYVTTEDGTGIVHIAPTFGADDAFVAKKAGVPGMVFITKKGEQRPMVDMTGKFFNIADLDEDFVKNQVDVAAYEPWAGRYVKNAYDANLTDKDETLDVSICIWLKGENKAFRIEKHVHNYPHCWRTDKPVLYYPLDSWFIRSTQAREEMMALNNTINWQPESTGTGRFGKWLENLNDWNLSRSRYWGTPLPIWRTEDGQEEICIGSIAELMQEIEKSIAAGFMSENPWPKHEVGNYSKENYDPAIIDLHRPYVDNIILCSPSGKPMKRELDLIDVWFDSGAMPYAQNHYPFENQDAPRTADFISEGVDQTRGWFFTLHAIHTMIEGSVAYKNVISNGLVLDKNGNKMSKRLGNAVDPFGALDKYGADAVRWYMLTNSSPWENLKFDPEGVDEIRRKFFGTLYNTYGFFALYANVDNWGGDEAMRRLGDEASLTEIDKWVLSKLNSLVKEVTAAYEAYEPTKAGRAVSDFVQDDLSNWYVRLNRKRFWGGGMSEDKLAAYQTLYTCLETVVTLSAPFAPFISEQTFADLNAVSGNHSDSVHLNPFPKASTALTEGVTPDGNSLNVSTVTATVHQYGDYIVQSDVLELTALDNTVLEAAKLLGRQAGVTLDTVVRNILHTGTNVTYCPKVATGGAETAVTSRSGLDATSQLTVKVIQQVVAKLRGQNAPTIGGKYVAIIHPYVAYDLMRDPEWIDAHKYANPSNLYEGEIGEIAGVRFVQTTEAKVYDGGVFSTLFLGEGAYGVTEITGGGLQTIVKQKGSAGTADPLDQRSSVGWKAIKTAEILIENYLVRVESKSAVFSATTNAN